MRWADAEFEILKEMAANGFSGSLIGQAVGKTRMAVIGKCHREGIILRGEKCNPSPCDIFRVATYCIHGHLFNEANTYHYTQKNGNPGRKCRKCQNDWHRRKRDLALAQEIGTNREPNMDDDLWILMYS